MIIIVSDVLNIGNDAWNITWTERVIINLDVTVKELHKVWRTTSNFDIRHGEINRHGVQTVCLCVSGKFFWSWDGSHEQKNSACCDKWVIELRVLRFRLFTVVSICEDYIKIGSEIQTEMFARIQGRPVMRSVKGVR